MKPEDVPDELVDSTAKPISQHVTYCDFGDSWRDCHTCRKTYGQVRSILSVALPAHEAMVRAKIAEEIRALYPPDYVPADRLCERIRGDQ